LASGIKEILTADEDLHEDKSSVKKKKKGKKIKKTKTLRSNSNQN
jgi:hypothetical protein